MHCFLFYFHNVFAFFLLFLFNALPGIFFSYSWVFISGIGFPEIFSKRVKHFPSHVAFLASVSRVHILLICQLSKRKAKVITFGRMDGHTHPLTHTSTSHTHIHPSTQSVILPQSSRPSEDKCITTPNCIVACVCVCGSSCPTLL